jgi:ribosomal protein S12 methylthiotransferase
MRGDLVSRPVGDVLKEASKPCSKAGVKELLVISQDTSAYGVDVRVPNRFLGRQVRSRRGCFELVQSPRATLAEAHGAWVRLHYVYPYPQRGRHHCPHGRPERCLPYLDVPFQHSHPEVLRRMKRPASGERNLERIATLARDVS